MKDRETRSITNLELIRTVVGEVLSEGLHISDHVMGCSAVHHPGRWWVRGRRIRVWHVGSVGLGGGRIRVRVGG